MFMGKNLNIMKMSVLPKKTYRFSTILIKISAGYFGILINQCKVYMDGPNTQNSHLDIEEEQSQSTFTIQLQDLP